MLDAEHAVYQTTSLLIALNDYAAANPTLISWTLTGSASGYPVFSTFKEPPNYEPDPPVPPALFSFTITGSDVTIKATDLQPGATYVLERSFSLITPQWLPLDTAVADIENNTLTFIQEHSPDEPRAFYRVRVQ
jgi:hypothetical protein